MPDTKLDLKKLGPIRLMALDTSSLFLPFGHPVADYLRGLVESHNGTRALLKSGAVPFSPAPRWTQSTARALRTTGFGELERDGIVESASGAAKAGEPGMADFLPLPAPAAVTPAKDLFRSAAAISPEQTPISKPRIASLPLRRRMMFGPPPGSKAKPIAAVPTKPVVVAPPKPAAIAKTPAAAAIPPKPVTAIPPAPKPVVAPAAAAKPVAAPAVQKVAPAARAAVPVTSKPGPVPVVVTRTSAPPPPQSQRTASAAVSTLDAPPASAAKPVAAPVAKSPQPSVSPMPAPARETVAQKPVEAAASPSARREMFGGSIEPRLTMGAEAESGSFIDRIPLPVRIGIAVLLLSIAAYFIFGKAAKAPVSSGVAVGEQGWSVEWASDAAGSRRGRQLTLYRPSVGMTDYQLKFVGQIESKALGWVFRETNTNNYYGMKIETLRPGAMALSHFAVVQGKETSYSQRPLGIDARPGAAYNVTIDVRGPRFTTYIGGEPVDFWTDNRLKAGAMGFMNERDERGATSSVNFSFLRAGQ